MNTYKLIVSTPDGYAFEDDVCALYLRGADGDLAVMAGHIPFATVVKKGDCKIELKDGGTVNADIGSGILTVGDKETILLSGFFEKRDDR